jgi:hypothetical protein
MKKRFVRALIGIFLCGIWSLSAHESTERLRALLKNTQGFIQKAYGVQELSYNKSVKKFLRLCDRLDKDPTVLININDIVRESAVVLDDYKEGDQQCYQAVFFCATAHEVFVLLRDYSSQLIEILTAIDQALVYWHEQAHHPVYYFFHKSPAKWFKKAGQQIEIKKNIKRLQQFKEFYCESLGAATIQRAALDECQDNEALMEWVHKGLHILYDVKKSKRFLLNEQVDIQKHVKILAKGVDTYAFRVEKKLATRELLIPAHRERHWLFYSSMVLTASFALWYSTTHKQRMEQFQKAVAIMRAEMYDDLKRPLIGFKEAFLQDSHGKEFRVAQLWKNLEEEREVFVKQALQFFPPQEFSEVQIGKIKANLIKLKTVDISNRYLSKMNGSKLGKLWNAPDIGAGVLYEISGLKLNMLSLINEVYNELFKNVRGNKFTIAVASSVPLYGIFIGICAGLSKAYSMIFYRWFNALALQTTLKKVNDLFIDVYHEEEISPMIYGNVIYLLTVLKKQVHCVAKHQKADFVRDCDRLASLQKTVPQKVQIIANMRAYYTHLC